MATNITTAAAAATDTATATPRDLSEIGLTDCHQLSFCRESLQNHMPNLESGGVLRCQKAQQLRFGVHCNLPLIPRRFMQRCS